VTSQINNEMDRDYVCVCVCVFLHAWNEHYYGLEIQGRDVKAKMMAKVKIAFLS
jgi:hypothetical protein